MQMCQSQQQQTKKSPPEKNPAEDHVVSNNDHVGYEVDNTYEPASEQWGVHKLMPQWAMK
jgi:hypothetical protein